MSSAKDFIKNHWTVRERLFCSSFYVATAFFLLWVAIVNPEINRRLIHPDIYADIIDPFIYISNCEDKFAVDDADFSGTEFEWSMIESGHVSRWDKNYVTFDCEGLYPSIYVNGSSLTDTENDHILSRKEKFALLSEICSGDYDFEFNIDEVTYTGEFQSEASYLARFFNAEVSGRYKGHLSIYLIPVKVHESRTDIWEVITYKDCFPVKKIIEVALVSLLFGAFIFAVLTLLKGEKGIITVVILSAILLALFSYITTYIAHREIDLNGYDRYLYDSKRLEEIKEAKENP